MKSFSLLLIAFSASTSMAFMPSSTPSCTRSRAILSAQLEMTPELEGAIAEVREAASAFGEETAHFANVWIDRTIAGNVQGTAAGLLDECVLDDGEGKCERFSNALENLDKLLGVGAGEQF
ncbi:predicted protein [Thalassiosira pseudonana CCMP1335]|uniref:Uncharacterized protein n=1 Tax=Thalassiosira pseudonana TaxID=35128 RepID=B8C991_THAPS|nr:predicted protein [Thalassiosira pseudonana CCMP1335]EED90006.1 predicted protein [Thalassiosira pseudonana CCMP1335]|eukprot:g5891.t1 g5891   contig20:381572-382162(-)